MYEPSPLTPPLTPTLTAVVTLDVSPKATFLFLNSAVVPLPIKSLVLKSGANPPNIESFSL